MEKEILDIIKRISYSDRIKELYDNRSKIIEFPLNITLNYKIIADFTDEYFFKYENILVENAIINALENNECKYIEFLNNHINDLKETLDNNIAFRIKTADLALKNIINKIYFNKNNDEKIKKDNKDIFNKIKNVYTSVNSISLTYRKFIMTFLETKNELEKEKLLDIFILSNIFDSIIIDISNNLLKPKDLLDFKIILIRLILFDNYLHIETIKEDSEEEKDNENIYYLDHKELGSVEEEVYEEKDEEYILDDDDINVEIVEMVDCNKLYNEENKLILTHIKNCIKYNKYVLPEDENLRTAIYSRFISYNLYIPNKEENYNLIKDDKEKVLNLKKINPLYKLEFVNFKINEK